MAARHCGPRLSPGCSSGLPHPACGASGANRSRSRDEAWLARCSRSTKVRCTGCWRRVLRASDTHVSERVLDSALQAGLRLPSIVDLRRELREGLHHRCGLRHGQCAGHRSVRGQSGFELRREGVCLAASAGLKIVSLTAPGTTLNGFASGKAGRAVAERRGRHEGTLKESDRA